MAAAEPKPRTFPEMAKHIVDGFNLRTAAHGDNVRTAYLAQALLNALAELSLQVWYGSQ